MSRVNRYARKILSFNFVFLIAVVSLFVVPSAAWYVGHTAWVLVEKGYFLSVYLLGLLKVAAIASGDYIVYAFHSMVQSAIDFYGFVVSQVSCFIKFMGSYMPEAVFDDGSYDLAKIGIGLGLAFLVWLIVWVVRNISKIRNKKRPGWWFWFSGSGVVFFSGILLLVIGLSISQTVLILLGWCLVSFAVFYFMFDVKNDRRFSRWLKELGFLIVCCNSGDTLSERRGWFFRLEGEDEDRFVSDKYIEAQDKQENRSIKRSLEIMRGCNYVFAEDEYAKEQLLKAVGVIKRVLEEMEVVNEGDETLINTSVDIKKWTPFDYAQNSVNFNIAVIGGEEYRAKFLEQYIDGFLGEDGRPRDSEKICVLDYSGKLAREYNSIDVAEKGIKINPFELIKLNKDLDECLVYIRDFISILLDNDLNELERGFLSKAAKSCVYRSRESGNAVPDLRGMVYELEQSQQSYGLSLKLESALADNFNDLRGEVDFNFGRGWGASSWNILDFSGVKNYKHRAILTSYVLSYISLSIQKDRSRVCQHIIINGVRKINRGLARHLEALSRRLRRHNGSLVCGSSSLSGFSGNDCWSDIFKNSNWKCLFKQDDKSIEELRDTTHPLISDALYRNLQDGEYIMGGAMCGEIIKGRV